MNNGHHLIQWKSYHSFSYFSLPILTLLVPTNMWDNAKNKENINTEIALSKWHLVFVKCIDSKVYILISEKLSHGNEFIIKAAQLI